MRRRKSSPFSDQCLTAELICPHLTRVARCDPQASSTLNTPIADREINSLVVGLIAKLRDDEVKGALAEYARWTWIRDRLCDLDDKDDVPLEELSSAEPCLADYMKQKTAEIVAAKGDPKRLFGHELLSPAPDADAVDLCVSEKSIRPTRAKIS